MPARRMSANRQAIAKMLRPGEQCEVCVDVRLPGPVHVTTAGAEGSFRYRLVQAFRERGSWPARCSCLVTDQRVVFAFRQLSQEFVPLLELRPQDITAVIGRRAWPGWQVVIEFSDASAVSLDVSGPDASTAASQLASLLAPRRMPGPRAQQALTSNGGQPEPGGTGNRRPAPGQPPSLTARTGRWAGWLAGIWGALLFTGVAVASAAGRGPGPVAGLMAWPDRSDPGSSSAPWTRGSDTNVSPMPPERHQGFTDAVGGGDLARQASRVVG